MNCGLSYTSMEKESPVQQRQRMKGRERTIKLLNSSQCVIRKWFPNIPQLERRDEQPFMQFQLSFTELSEQIVVLFNWVAFEVLNKKKKVNHIKQILNLQHQNVAIRASSFDCGILVSLSVEYSHHVDMTKWLLRRSTWVTIDKNKHCTTSKRSKKDRAHTRERALN